MKYQAPYGVSDPNASYINGDPSIGRQGSIPPAAAFEEPMRELMAMIERSGIVGSDADLAQLLKAVRSQYVNSAQASGTDSALVVTFNPPIATATIGMPLRVHAVVDNTGPATLSVDGVVHPITRADGAALAAGDIKAGQILDLLFDGADWQMANFRGLFADTVNNNNYITKIPYAPDTGTVNHLIGVFSPAITTLAAGDTLEVKLANTITGPADIVVNGLPAKTIVRAGNTPLQSGDAVAGQMILMMFDGVKFQLTGISQATASSGNFVPGCIYLWPTEVAPAGTLECNGAAVPRTGNTARLFGILGTMYGAGDGSTTFNVPDYRGDFLRGWDHGRGVDPNASTRVDRGDGTTGDHIGTKEVASIRVADINGSIQIVDPVFESGLTGWYGGTGAGGGAGAFVPAYIAQPTAPEAIQFGGILAGMNPDGQFPPFPPPGQGTYMTPPTGDSRIDGKFKFASPPSTQIETRPVNVNTMYVIAL
jgi:hypothetical protein